MAQLSPLNTLHEQAEASFLMYGAAQGGAPVVETFGEIETEYAAIRKGCVLIDQPQRGTLLVEGDDRLEFLGRMVTAPCDSLRPFESKRAFWLNRKGRIDADLRLLQLEQRMLIDVDVLVASSASETLNAFVFAEDVRIADQSDVWHRLALHGPKSLELIQSVATHAGGPPCSDLIDLSACEVLIAGRPVIVNRQDALGCLGLELFVQVEDVAAVYEQLVERGLSPDNTIAFKAAGWAAFNIARIESGWPMFNVDFGANSLPHESGVLNDRVSFTKGCYLGQEVVARMQSLGHPKQKLVGLSVDPITDGPEGEEQPETGAPVLAPASEPDEAKTVGAVTSSARSPMLGDRAICFAQVKWEFTPPGTVLSVRTAGGQARATVQPDLRFWPPHGS